MGVLLFWMSFLLTLLLLPKVSNAQFEQSINPLTDIFSSGLPQPRLEIKPQHPSGHTEVEVSLPSTLTNTTDIVWSIDGVSQQALANERSISLTTKDLGEPTTVSAVLRNSDGSAQTFTEVITPIALDITIEGKTMVPGFYDGRRLVSRGAEVLITAIPQTGTPVPHENFLYRWQVGGRVIDGGMVKGRFQQLLQAPVSQPELVRVEVFGSENNLLVSKVFELEFFDPIFRFYESSPLRGVSPLELGMHALAPNTELTVRAEPYYFDPAMLKEEHQLRWDINRQAVHSDSGDELQTTVNIQGSGNARMNASLRSAKQLLQFADGQTTLRFDE